MSNTIPLLRDLPVITEDSQKFVIFQDFTAFLKAKRGSRDSIIKNCNIFAWLKGKAKHVKIVNEKPAFEVNHALHFMFAHSDKFEICKKVVYQIQANVFSAKDVPYSSTKEIYDDVIKLNLLTDCFELELIVETNVQTLNSSYKHEYDCEAWKKICLFELQFSQSFPIDVAMESYESLIYKKAAYIGSLKSTLNLAQCFKRDSRHQIERRSQRKDLGDNETAISLCCKKQHCPIVLEATLHKSMPDDELITRVVSVDCTKACLHSRALHLYVETTTQDEKSLVNLASVLQGCLKKQHQEECAEIFFFEEGSLNKFRDRDGEIMRFELRDQVISKKMDQHIIKYWKTLDQENSQKCIQNSSVERCCRCYGQVLLNPLSMQTFDILTEWYIETPLIFQILLTTFINPNSMQRTENKKEFLKAKFSRLYQHYDTLLNVYNRKYCGILQDRNTQELSMHYQSINSVFNITSGSGITQSLNVAENKLKRKAHNELTYYNTFLRRHPMTYNSVSGLITRKLCIRDCILILMMDNLVRLKKLTDPNPGESRSLQMCTLPITLKGVPQNAIDVDQWHDSSCDANTNDTDCICKKDVQLTKDSLETCVLQLSMEEKVSLKKFETLCSFGFQQIWSELFQDGTHMITSKVFQDVELEESFASMQIEEFENDLDHTRSVLQKDEGNTPVLQLAFNNTEEEALMNIDFDTLVAPTDDHHTDAESVILEDSFVGYLIQERDGELVRTNIITEEMVENGAQCTEEESMSSLNGLMHTQPPDSIPAEKYSVTPALQKLGFHQFKPPPLLIKHPPPALGRDDDVKKLQEVLDDILLKTDNLHKTSHKILFAPDHKIASNLLKLQNSSSKYTAFLAEFPVLHLRKSKINILCSAYKDAGILHILKYMRDENFQDWRKLISAEHIEMATKYIRRLSIALHIAFFSKYLQFLPYEKRIHIEQVIMTDSGDEQHWVDFEEFLERGKRNGTFSLHLDMMQHCNEVSALALAERLGGHDGYNLLLAAVKSGLRFSFLNGATSYAAFTTQLLHEHFKSGTYYQNMKKCLFTTPVEESEINFALDTQREMEHRDVLKAFRSGSTLSSVMPRMSLIDSFNEIHSMTRCSVVKKQPGKPLDELLGLKMNETDTKYIKRIVGLVLRQGALETEENPDVYNVYDPNRPVISNVLLDDNTKDVGEYLIRKFISSSNLFGCSPSDMPNIENVVGPKQLLQKLKTSKAVTIRRTSVPIKLSDKTQREIKEEKRQKFVKRETKKIDCLSSDMNACQAVVKPDCSKPKVGKSVGMKKALTDVLIKSIMKLESSSDTKTALADGKFVKSSLKTVPKELADSVTMATIEFAGVKFKAKSTSGSQYLKYIEGGIIMKTKMMFPRVKKMVVCEEKYSFTPDDFKAATRSQRVTKKNSSITHLKTSTEMLSLDKFDRQSIVETSEGKKLISTYLARHIDKISIPVALTLVIDSEFVKEPCSCRGQGCVCDISTHPIEVEFPNMTDYKVLKHIRQKKGEAEMAQIDWLVEDASILRAGEACVSIVTSGDIDSVVLHLFSIAHLWPRDDNGFKNVVYVLLQKPGNVFDIYNITAILTLLEKAWKDKFVGHKLALVLSIGGNDFLPKFHNISHQATLDLFFKKEKYFNNLFNITYSQNCILTINLDDDLYSDFVKALYTPKRQDPTNFTFEEIRQITIQPPSQTNLRNPQLWMPPLSAVKQLAKNIHCLIAYYMTAGNHSAATPDFLQDGCLTKLRDGSIEYNLGDETQVNDIRTYLMVNRDIICAKLSQPKIKMGKRKPENTPQKGRRRKLKPYTSTPKKEDDRN